MSHRLDPLLSPKSIAIVGASPKEHSAGWLTLRNLELGGYEGTIYAINPGYEAIGELTCYASLRDLPAKPQHVYFAVSNQRLEAALDEAIEVGAEAVTIITTLFVEHDQQPTLRQRIAQKLTSAGILCCGGNGMGFYNFQNGVWLTSFETRSHVRGGNVALISQSGSGMCGLVDVEERIDFSLAVSSGQELTVTMDAYVDYALDMPGTRAVGLFVETFRNPQGIISAFEKANAKRIPIVAVKVGRTDLSAELALSHSGALVGTDSTYDALFERYGVIRVADLDELATTLVMFAQPKDVGDGGLVSLHDSGGERQLVADLADEIGVPLTELSNETVETLEKLLDPGLPAVNPLDNWADGGEDFDVRSGQMFAVMCQDEGAAVGAVIQARIAHSKISPEYLTYLKRGQETSGKPVFLVSGCQGTGADERVITSTRNGMPVLDGVQPFLKGVRHLFDYRDYLRRDQTRFASVDGLMCETWKVKLAGQKRLGELEAAGFLADFGLPTVTYSFVDDEKGAIAAAVEIGYPVVLKSAAPDLDHKSDIGGIYLNLSTCEEVTVAYRDLSSRLGHHVIVTPMITEPGVELFLGAKRDDQFGPIITFGFGGLYIEAIKEAVFLMPPFNADTARRKLDTLKMRPLLNGGRGQPALDVNAFCDMAARFSQIISAFEDEFSEFDINPVLVMKNGCIALDALAFVETDRSK